MWNIRLQAPKLARKCEIQYWLPCGADGLAYGHVTTKLFGWIDHNQIFLAFRLRSRALRERVEVRY